MQFEQTDSRRYGLLRLAFEDRIEWFAVSPDATLEDVAGVFIASDAPDYREPVAIELTLAAAGRPGVLANRRWTPGAREAG